LRKLKDFPVEYPHQHKTNASSKPLPPFQEGAEAEIETASTSTSEGTSPSTQEASPTRGRFLFYKYLKSLGKMRDQEIIGLWEAYQQVHAQPQEEVELDEGRTTSLQALSRESAKRKADKERGRPETESEVHGRLMMGNFRPGASPKERAAGGRQRLKDRGKVPQKDGKDMFEHILEYLVTEGYAATNKEALVIMANMSEEWKQSIVEQNAIVTTGTSTNAAGEKIPFTHRVEPSGKRTVEDKFGKRELREPRLKGV